MVVKDRPQDGRESFRKLIVYNGSFLLPNVAMAGSKNPRSYFALAHEVAHQLFGHALDGVPSAAIELDADRVAGYIIAFMGFTRQQAEDGVQIVATSEIPSFDQRKVAVLAGWDKAQARLGTKEKGVPFSIPAYSSGHKLKYLLAGSAADSDKNFGSGLRTTVDLNLSLIRRTNQLIGYDLVVNGVLRFEELGGNRSTFYKDIQGQVIGSRPFATYAELQDSAGQKQADVKRIAVFSKEWGPPANGDQAYPTEFGPGVGQTPGVIDQDDLAKMATANWKTAEVEIPLHDLRVAGTDVPH